MHVPMRKELEMPLVIATNVIPLMDLMDKEGRAASSMLMVTHKNAKMFLKAHFIIMVIICVCLFQVEKLIDLMTEYHVVL